MKFVIASSNVKTFAKSILVLSKIGDEIYIEPLQNSLTIRTVNSSRSAFAYFAFKPSFFTQFEPFLYNKNRLNITGRGDESISYANSTKNRKPNETIQEDESMIEEIDAFKCKIPAKCLLSIFKNINSLEKNVEKCTITVKYIPINPEDTAAKVADYDSTMVTKKLNKNNEEQLYDIKFLIIMNCRHSMRKTFILSISDCENLQAAFSADKCSNKLNISAKYLHETVNCFSTDTEEVSFIVEANKLYIKNYVETENADAKSIINTQVNFDSAEFNHYEIEKETDITFCLKEFKICLQFGYWFDLPVDIFYQKKGRPIIFNYNAGNLYEASFTLATLAEDLATTQNTTLSTNPNLSIYQTGNKNNKTLSDTFSGTNLNRSAAKTAKLSNREDIEKSTKTNKRSLFDASNNQVYLDESIANNGKFKMNKDDNENDEEEDDALLTQALKRQENARNSKTNSPPSKKIKSLVQTLFEDDEDEEMKEDGRNNKSNKRITFANLLETTRNQEELLGEEKRAQNSIYIEETSSEDDESD